MPWISKWKWHWTQDLSNLIRYWRQLIFFPHWLQHIFISLVSFDVRFETTCRLNSFTILTPFFKQFCAILSGEDILIPSNNMTAVFTSHSVFSSSGFHIEYQAVEPEATPRKYCSAWISMTVNLKFWSTFLLNMQTANTFGPTLVLLY